MARRWLQLIFGAVLTAGLVVACGSSATNTTGAGAARSAKIKVGQITAVDTAGFHLAIHNGYFDREHLKVDPRETTSDDILSGLHSGKYNFGFLSYVDAVQATSNGVAKLQLVAEAYASGTGEATKPTMAVVTLKDSPIQKPADLAGKKIAVNNTNGLGPLLIRAHMHAQGADPSKVEFLDFPFNQMDADLQRHVVDAAWMGTEPFLTQAQQKGMRTLINTSAPPTANIPIAGYFTTPTYAKTHPHQVEAFRRAMHSGQLAASNRAQVEAVLPTYIPKMSPALAATIAVGAFPTSTPAQSLAQLQRVPDLMTQYGLLKGQVDFNKLLVAQR